MLRGEEPPPENVVARVAPNVSRPPLVGRADELADLQSAWQRAATGQPGLVLVVGEAGIGKTTLVDELARAASESGGTVLSARCYEAERSLFIQPYVEAISNFVRTSSPDLLRGIAAEHLDALARLMPEVATLLGLTVTPLVEDAAMERRRAFEALATFIHVLASRTPVLLSLDDVQNAGLSSIELMHYLVRRSARDRVLFVATVRGEEGSDVIARLSGVAGMVELGPLTVDAIEELAGAADQGDQLEDIVRRTRGHTLYVVETLRALASGDVGVPDSLEAAVMNRVQRVGRRVESTLRAAAVLGPSFDVITLAHLLGESAASVVSTCSEAADARLLVVGERDYEFANDLIRDVLYQTMAAPARRAFHARAADVLAGSPEAVALHASAAEDWTRAARAWLVAGEEALRRAAASDAVDLLTRSHEAAVTADDAEVAARAMLIRGIAREALTEFRAALSDFTEASTRAREIGDRRLEMAALRQLGGDVNAALRRPLGDSVAPLERGLAIAATLSDRAMEADFRSRLAVIATNAMRFDEALDQGRAAVAAARASGSDRALAVALDGLKTPCAYLGEVSELVPVLEELEPLLRQQGDNQKLPWAVFESMFPALAAGEYDAAATRIAEAVETAMRGGYHAVVPFFRSYLCDVRRLQGRYDEAIAIGRDAVAVSRESGHSWWAATAGAALGHALLATTALDEAVTVLSSAAAAAEYDGAEIYRLRCLAPLAEATGSAEVLTRADDLLRRVRAPSGTAMMAAADVYLSIARSWLARGEPARARAVLEPLLTAATRVPWVGVLAAAEQLHSRAAQAQ